eukprot:2218394-Pyramimonas_sp.AAC.1
MSFFSREPSRWSRARRISAVLAVVLATIALDTIGVDICPFLPGASLSGSSLNRRFTSLLEMYGNMPHSFT